MNFLVMQSLICVLIALWGVVTLAVGVVWFNPTWLGLGLAVLIAGLPFVVNALRKNGAPSQDLFSP
jgi:hypothetical protein